MATTPASRVTPPVSPPADGAAARPPGDVWGDFAAELASLTELARAADSAEAFYHEALRRSVTTLAAAGGAVWTPQPGGRMRRVCLITPSDADRQTPGRLHPDADDRLRHEQLLAEVARSGEPKIVAANTESNHPADANRSPYTLVVTPVATRDQVAALIELQMPPGGSPALYRGAQQLLAAVAEVAAEYHAYADLARLHGVCADQQRLLTLAERVHAALTLDQTAATIAKEARDAIGCGRVSVLARRGRYCRLLAVSGVEQADRRSRTVRGLQEIASISCRLGDPLYLAVDDPSDEHDAALPQADDALHAYADESSARQIAVTPLVRPAEEQAHPDDIVIGALVAESFAAGDAPLARDRVAEVARVCGAALGNALEHDATPLVGLTRPLRGLTRPSTLVKLAAVAVVLAASAAALVLVPAELRIEARGELQPVNQRNVFAPDNAVVQRVLVTHGQQVEAGDLLMELRDASLELELKQLDGERQTAQRQLDAVRATRASLDARQSDRAQTYRLSAEEQQLGQRLASLDEQLRLLESRRQALQVTSPVSGMVVTWALDETLSGRPVERGQNLMSVADTAGPWRVELRLPDDRIGYLVDSQSSSWLPLQVEYRLGSQEEGFLVGSVAEIAQRADDQPAGAEADGPRVIEVRVTPQPGDLSPDDPEVRPGATVRARVLCGERSLGYVLAHDLINAVRVWWEF